MSEQALIVEPDRIIMRGEWAHEVIYDVTYSGTENLPAFEEAFEIVGTKFMADPGEDFYQGIEFMTVIRRKSDGRLFGYQRWEPVAKYAEAPEVESNGEEHGFEYEYDADYTEVLGGEVFVWQPLEPFTITGYRITATTARHDRETRAAEAAGSDAEEATE